MAERNAATQTYEIRSAIRCDTETAKFLQETLEAVMTAMFCPDRVDWSVWLHLTMVSAMANAAMHKKEPDRFLSEPVGVFPEFSGWTR